MTKNLLIFLFFVLLLSSAFGQDSKFGGPFTSISFNKYGTSLSAGGGGTFLTNKGFFSGVFGQGTTDVFKRHIEINNVNYLLKSRQTGVWIGYYSNYKNTSRVGFSFYNKVGFGSVTLDYPETSFNYYDGAVVFSPNIELSYRLTSFLELGFAVQYEFFTGVNLLGLTNADFNSFGASVLFKFKVAE